MKKFIIKGPKTERTVTIQDDEILEWRVIKFKDYQQREENGWD